MERLTGRLDSTAQFIQIGRSDHSSTRERVCAELGASLLAEVPFVAPKYLYDALGSHLFEAITELAEYYPTRTEASIFADNAPAIAQAAGTGKVLIDLGAASCAKAARLFPHLLPRQYVPVDISVDFLRVAVGALQQRHPDIPMLGVGVDFSTELQLPPEVQTGERLFFYPGSSIGNFTPDEARVFLSQVAAQAAVNGSGGLLIGVDLVKSKSILEPAYDDNIGVTAAFNRNLLLNVNRWLGSDFNPAQWDHVGLYNEKASRIEMHLQAKQALRVAWPGGQRTFTKGQRLHTENSYKYTVDGFANLLKSAGFGQVQHWSDGQEWFGVFYASLG